MRIEAGEYPRKILEKTKWQFFFWFEWGKTEFHLLRNWNDILEKARIKKNISDKIFRKEKKKEVYLEKRYCKRKPYKFK